MLPSIPYLRQKFSEFNQQIFNGRLPEPAITLCAVSSFVGQFKSKVRKGEDGSREFYDYQLRFSTSFNLPEAVLEDTLIHEMIHYFIAYNGLYDRSAHGPLFKSLMQSINEAHGRSITISHRTTGSEMAEAKSAKKKWHVIAILHFKSGEKGVKVLPRVIPRIIDYHKRVAVATNIRSVDLYLHNDPYFNRFPTSTGARCHSITPTEISLHLRGAHTLHVEGSKLIQRYSRTIKSLGH